MLRRLLPSSLLSLLILTVSVSAQIPAKVDRSADAAAIRAHVESIFHGPELAVASFIGEFERKAGNAVVTTNRLHIMDVYAKRNGNWIQVASHTVVDPAWRSEQTSIPMTVTAQMRQRILAAREAVWKAYFANDRTALEKRKV